MNGRELKEGLGRATRGQHGRSFTRMFLRPLPPDSIPTPPFFLFRSSITTLPSKKTNPKIGDGQWVAPIGALGVHTHPPIPFHSISPLELKAPKPQSYNHKSHLFMPRGAYTRETLGLSLKAQFPIGRPSICPHTNVGTKDTLVMCTC